MNDIEETRQAHLNAIIDNPKDDTPRLVYADRLDDWGECERAEFIRVQCELAKLQDWGRTTPPTPELSAAAKEVRRLSNRASELCDWGWTGLDVIHDGLAWHRGFIAEVFCTLEQWMGEQCTACNRTGTVKVYTGHGDYTDEVCLRCTGLVGPGIGPRLAQRNPVELVKLTDKEPYPVLMDMGEVLDYTYLSDPLPYDVIDDTEAVAATIPNDLWQIYHKVKDGQMHQTADEANECLSRALIQWARMQEVQS